jgi:hypothetical protein
MIHFQFSTKIRICRCLPMVVAVALAIGSKLINMRWKAEPVIYKFGFWSILSFIFLWSKVQIARYAAVCPELSSAAPPNCSDRNCWIVGRMRAYLCFMERSQNSLSLLHWTFLLILHRIQSAEFCEIIVSPIQNLYSRFFHLCTVFQQE